MGAAGRGEPGLSSSLAPAASSQAAPGSSPWTPGSECEGRCYGWTLRAESLPQHRVAAVIAVGRALSGVGLCPGKG